ncbi:cation channel family protein (macronuclear) [Tetrahymena thermophila SB210]|uniref:Cation channel family protein n=1 Tax=Tetrahymena thermophila (strain SB210) TaxID=312017 RepID=Q24DS3_TETTS|nr:cation channel family protein [Tetrahymena thermophila SB210]EAS05917.2 cation channel family protein [Tetrahymena thermophila SB210]|eukprot:XP_001026162.2 cation channel family protein [Tetrahymena thermophila SB210]
MSQTDCKFYNDQYRNRIQLYEEENKLFQNMPYKCDDSIVEQEPISQISRFEQNRYEEMQMNTQKGKVNFLDEDNQKNGQDKSNQKLGKKLDNKTFQTQRTRQRSSPNNINNMITQYQDQSLANTINLDDDDEEQKAQPIKLIKALKLLVNIQHFYRVLTSNVRVLNKLTHKQHQLIGDISSFYSKSYQKDKDKYYFIIGRLWANLTQKIENIYIPVFQPSNKLIKAWDSFLSLLIMLFTLLLNLQLFFGMNISNFYLLYNVLIIFSIIDIIVELNTGVVQKGNVINDRQFIFKSYLKNIFIFDLFGNFSLLLFIIESESSGQLELLINILFLFKWVKITKILKEATYYFSYEKNHKNLVDLLKLLFFVIGICHIFCLFWHGLGQLSINRGETDNWIQSKNLVDANTFERYIYSFYFLAVTMATVGYGDITPQNDMEVLFTAITIFVTCIVYAFSINTIGSIIENIEKKDKKYKENLQIIHGVMREENVSRELKIKISNYVEYLYKESNEIQKKQENLIINKLSAKLRNDLTLEIQGKYLNNIPLFKNIKEKDKVTSIMEEQLYSPGEIIFKQEELDDCSIYYIVKGSVAILYHQSNKNREELIIAIKGKSEYFGEHSFINGKSRSLTAKATDFCRIYKISRQGFQQAIKQYEYEFENFQMTQEAILFNNNYKLCSFTCSICNSSNHIPMNCPKTHLVLTKQVVISRYNQWNPHLQREKFYRKQKKTHVLNQIQLLQQAVEEINCHESLFDILDQLEIGLGISYMHIDSQQASQSLNSLTKLEEKVDPQKKQETNNQDNSQMNFKSQIYYESDSSNNIDQSKQASNSVGYNKEKTSSSFLQKNLDSNFSQQQKTKRSFQPTQQSFQNSESEIKQNDFSSSQSLDDQTLTSFSNKDTYSRDYEQLKQVMIQIENGQRQLDYEQNSFQKGQDKLQEQQNQQKIIPTINYPTNNKSTQEYKQKLKSKLAQETETFEERNQLDQKQQIEQLLSEQVEQPNLQIIRSRNSFKTALNQQNQEQIKENQNIQNGNRRESIFADNQHREKLFPSQQMYNALNLRERRRRNQIDVVQNSIYAFISQQSQKQNQGKKFIIDENLQDQKPKKKFSIKNFQNNMNLENFSKKPRSQIEQILTNEYVSSLQNATERGTFPDKKMISAFEEKIQGILEPPDQVNYRMLQIFDKAKIFKFYHPSYNYLEIVKKWIKFQEKHQNKYANLSQKRSRFNSKSKKFNQTSICKYYDM